MGKQKGSYKSWLLCKNAENSTKKCTYSPNANASRVGTDQAAHARNDVDSFIVRLKNYWVLLNTLVKG